MPQISASGWFSWLASSTVLVFAFLFTVDHSLQAQPKTPLIVSFFNGNNSGTLLGFDSVTGSFIPGFSLTTGGGAGAGAEGAACITSGGVPALFVAQNIDKINVYNPTTFKPFSSTLGSFLINGANNISALSVSPDGSVLYAADYRGPGIWGLKTAPILATAKTGDTITADYSVGTTAAHDVAADPGNFAPANAPGGRVYTASFENVNDLGIVTSPATLSTTSTFISKTAADGVGLTHPGGLLFAHGSLWVSNFSGGDCAKTPLDCPAIFEFNSAGNVLHKITALDGLISNMAGSDPLGLALGPDGNVYVALFNTNGSSASPGSIGRIDVVGGTYALSTFIKNGDIAAAATASGTVASNPKYLQFIQNCNPAPNGFIEVCKLSSTTNPVPATGIYNFTVTGSAFSTIQNPLMVPVGECSGPIKVTPGADGTATIQELGTPGVAIFKITAVGYRAPPLSDEIDLLEGSNSQTGMAKVIVVPGGTSVQTLVTYTNYEAPAAQLKLCKIAGANVKVGTPFSFTVTPSTATVPPVEAGPLAQGGFCRLVDGTFQVGTSVTITETVLASDSPPAITVNGVSTPSTGCTPSTSAAYPCSVTAAIGPGINEVSFTNCIVPNAQVCPTGIIGENEGHQAPLEIVNYSVVRQQAVSGTQSYVTYRADLLNTGTDVGPMMARLTSLDPSSIQVVGQGHLNFEPAPADSQVPSSNTFTILVDAAVPVDFSKLNWTFHSRRSIPATR
jgi:hypothetical protein